MFKASTLNPKPLIPYKRSTEPKEEEHAESSQKLQGCRFAGLRVLGLGFMIPREQGIRRPRPLKHPKRQSHPRFPDGASLLRREPNVLRSHSKLESRVQVPKNRIPTRNLYHYHFHQNRKYLIIEHVDP